MTVIPHRELRNDSARVLSRVAAGESFTITNGGREVAVLMPVGRTVLDQLIESGQARVARKRPDFTALKRARGLSSREILDDLRGSV